MTMVFQKIEARRILFLAVALSSLAAQSAHATFHVMQIEQVIGGVNGNVNAQAIQLRLRVTGENMVSQARLIVRNAAGLNPVTVVDMTTNVANGAAGARVLIASSAFLANLPGITPDFLMTNVIPASYLAAGTLTYESDTGLIYWRLSWGGASYTGPGTGNVTNDPDGNFGPPFAGPLPSAGTQVLQFRFAASAESTNNANDYVLSPGSVSFVNNAGSSGSIDADADGVPTVADNCSAIANASQFDADHDGYGNICDADLNNSGLTTATDFNLQRSCLNQPSTASALCAAADMNGSGLVTATDFNLLRARINTAPGPSGLACAGIVPCP
jgi:hypothetical protein